MGRGLSKGGMIEIIRVRGMMRNLPHLEPNIPLL
jgi:hypothetical protein